MTFLRSWNTADAMFLFSYERNLFPLIPLGECHCNMDILNCQGECYEIVTFQFVSFSNFCFTYLAFSKIFSLEQYIFGIFNSSSSSENLPAISHKSPNSLFSCSDNCSQSTSKSYILVNQEQNVFISYVSFNTPLIKYHNCSFSVILISQLLSYFGIAGRFPIAFLAYSK